MDLVTNLQATKQVVPAIGSLDNPPSCFKAGIVLALRFFLAARFDMRDVAAARGRAARLRIVVALVATEMLARFLSGRRPPNDRRVERGAEHLHVVPVGARECDGQWHAVGVRQVVPFGAQFPPIGRVFPGLIPPLTGADTVAESSDWKRQSIPRSSS